jgi:transposase
MHVNQIEMNGHEQISVMKFFFLGGKRHKAIHTELKAVLGEEVVSLATVKRWCQRFKPGDLSVDDEFRAGRPMSDLKEVTSQFLSDEPYLSARLLAHRLALNVDTIKTILARDLGMKKSTGRWVPDELNSANKVQAVTKFKTLLTALLTDASENFAHVITGDESWFYYCDQSSAMFAHDRSEIVPRVSRTIASRKSMNTRFFTRNQLIKLAFLPGGQK